MAEIAPTCWQYQSFGRLEDFAGNSLAGDLVLRGKIRPDANVRLGHRGQGLKLTAGGFHRNWSTPGDLLGPPEVPFLTLLPFFFGGGFPY